MNNLYWHRGFGHRYGWHRGWGRGYGFPYRRWGYYPRGGCCGPVFFILALVMLLPFGVLIFH